MLRILKRRYCRSNMVAYLNGELSLRARRRVARYIDSDDVCYVEYLRQRDLQRELTRRIPAIGQPEAGQLDRIWSAIQADLNPPRSPATLSLRARYGLLGMAMALLLAMPLTMGNSVAAFNPASQPPPQIAEAVTVEPHVTEDVLVGLRAVETETRLDTTPQAETAELVLTATPIPAAD